MHTACTPARHLPTLPPRLRRGVSALFIGWGTSPVLASLASGILFFLLRTFVLRAKNSHERALYVMPLAVTLCAL